VLSVWDDGGQPCGQVIVSVLCDVILWEMPILSVMCRRRSEGSCWVCLGNLGSSGVEFMVLRRESQSVMSESGVVFLFVRVLMMEDQTTWVLTGSGGMGWRNWMRVFM
jgi:hypothetical protein